MHPNNYDIRLATHATEHHQFSKQRNWNYIEMTSRHIDGESLHNQEHNEDVSDEDIEDVSDEEISEIEDMRIDLELEAAEAEFKEQTKQLAESRRRSLVLEDQWAAFKVANIDFCEHLKGFKEDPIWAEITANVIADYTGLILRPLDLEMITLSRFANQVNKELEEMQAD
jgi:hypothetical protein